MASRSNLSGAAGAWCGVLPLAVLHQHLPRVTMDNWTVDNMCLLLAESMLSVLLYAVWSQLLICVGTIRQCNATLPWQAFAIAST